ncbi:hypothetical protein AGMMS49957_03210 [Synergistales bacterium]|nr:hypothetical protein AGMMS49957_03210 [Synergistales bacterium]
MVKIISDMKNKKAFLALFLAVLCVGWLARYVVRDINLDVDILRMSIEKMPAIVMENLDFEREISGDFWRAHIPRASRSDGIVEVSSIDVTRLAHDGKEWYFKSASGFYSEKTGSADFYGLLGTLETGSRVLNLESAKLLFLGHEISGDKNARDGYEFLFPDGFVAYDAEVLITAESARLDKDGVILLDKGGVIKWKKNLETDAWGAAE